MTELEFIQSLPQNLTEEQKLEKLNEWRANNPQPEVEEEVEERDAAIEVERQRQIAEWKESDGYKEFTKVAEPDKVITENGYDFKYTLNPETGDTQ